MFCRKNCQTRVKGLNLQSSDHLGNSDRQIFIRPLQNTGCCTEDGSFDQRENKNKLVQRRWTHAAARPETLNQKEKMHVGWRLFKTFEELRQENRHKHCFLKSYKVLSFYFFALMHTLQTCCV